MKKRNLFKLAALTAVFALGSMFANAQTNPTTGVTAITEADADGPVIKVIDNKGTVKYIQSNNGITTITSTASGNLTRTTFQLGGQLTDNTYIDLEGKEFGFQDLQYNGTTGTYDFVVIDATGNIKRMAMTDLVDAGNYIDVLTDNYIHSATVLTYTITTGVSLESFKTVYVFRNGAKLLAGVDYTIDNSTPTNSEVVLNLHVAASGTDAYQGIITGFEPYSLYTGDRIEIQFIK